MEIYILYTNNINNYGLKLNRICIQTNKLNGVPSKARCILMLTSAYVNILVQLYCPSKQTFLFLFVCSFNPNPPDMTDSHHTLHTTPHTQTHTLAERSTGAAKEQRTWSWLGVRWLAQGCSHQPWYLNRQPCDYPPRNSIKILLKI